MESTFSCFSDNQNLLSIRICLTPDFYNLRMQCQCILIPSASCITTTISICHCFVQVSDNNNYLLLLLLLVEYTSTTTQSTSHHTLTMLRKLKEIRFFKKHLTHTNFNTNKYLHTPIYLYAYQSESCFESAKTRSMSHMLC